MVVSPWLCYYLKDEEEMERILLAYSPQLRNILELAEQQIREGQGVPHQEFWKAVEAEGKSTS